MAILQSIKPQYCALIASGRKTIEVRKTRPKCELPVKVYIYCTKDKVPLLLPTYSKGNLTDSDIWQNGNGKVIGEYLCDEIEPKYCANGIAVYYENEQGTCLSDAELRMYADGVKPLYFWHISDLKIYDKPKELSEFGKECNLDCPSVRCPYWKYQRVNADEWDYDCSCNNIKPLTRPPQSWCYVEEVNNE